MRNKYIILHIPSGDYLRFYVSSNKPIMGTHKGLILTASKYFEEHRIQYIDFVLPSVITDATESDTYWDTYKEYRYFTSRVVSNHILDLFLEFIKSSDYEDSVLLYKDVQREEFEIVECAK